nr:hypothetical protein BaRGS_011434 [Batillaria attramentaria]
MGCKNLPGYRDMLTLVPPATPKTKRMIERGRGLQEQAYYEAFATTRQYRLPDVRDLPAQPQGAALPMHRPPVAYTDSTYFIHRRYEDTALVIFRQNQKKKGETVDDHYVARPQFSPTRQQSAELSKHPLRVFLHGGMAGSTFYDDLHILDLDKNTWVGVKKKRTFPSARAAHAAMAWTRIELQGPPPACRLDFALCVVELRVPRKGAPTQGTGELTQASGHAREVLERELKPGSASSRDSWTDVNASEAFFPIETADGATQDKSKAEETTTAQSTHKGENAEEVYLIVGAIFPMGFYLACRLKRQPNGGCIFTCENLGFCLGVLLCLFLLSWMISGKREAQTRYKDGARY